VLSRAPLPPDRALDVAIQLAEGLAAAHAAGIVHRDIKPENLFLTRQGHLKILDFGIAKLLEGAKAGAAPRTDTGVMMGTPGYMSPEQVQCEHATARSDVFAFGTVLHEMLSGKGPFERHTAVDSAHAILHDPAAPLPPSTPGPLARLIGRCLQKEPAARLADGSEVLAEVRKISLPAAQKKRGRWMIAPLAILLAGAIILVLRPRSKPGAVPPSIAVLPFADMSSSKDQEYFSDGIAEEILNVLAQVDGLRVIGRTSSFSMKGRNEDLRTIGQRLGATNLLEGSVRKSGARVRITAQLVEAEGGSHLWSQEFDRELTDVFAVQEEIAHAVVAALKLKLLPAPRQDPRAANPEAYDLYLLGRAFFARGSGDAFDRAVQALRKSVALDPGFAQAWAELAEALYQRGDFSLKGDLKADRPEGLVAAEKAIALAPQRADGYAARGVLRQLMLQDWTGARADLERARSLNPRSPDILLNYARLLAALGRLTEAISAGQQAAVLDPLSADVQYVLNTAYLGTGQLALAETAATRALEISPEYTRAARNLGITLLLQNRVPEARAAFHRSNHEFVIGMGDVMVEHWLGHPAESQRVLDRIFAGPWVEVAAYQIAQMYAWRGETNRAFDWLGRAAELHDGGLTYLKCDPLLRGLRGDARFAALLKKMNLPPD
jgi:TolB-like protein/Tfp pilus assembly protein PilF